MRAKDVKLLLIHFLIIQITYHTTGLSDLKLVKSQIKKSFLFVIWFDGQLRNKIFLWFAFLSLYEVN